MKNPVASILRAAGACLLATAGLALAQDTRPAITGISHMCVLASNMDSADHFYSHVLGGAKGPDPQSAQGVRYYFSPTQFVEVLPLPAEHSLSRMGCVSFNTADAGALRTYLQNKHVGDVGEVKTGSDGSRWFEAKDPEGNVVQFITPAANAVMATGGVLPVGNRVIHVGYMVHDRAKEDKFFRDVLGFRPYWFGAKNPDRVDWVSQQVPDGHDWLEYMLVGDGSDVPLSKVDARQLGVLNHFSIGVANMEQAVTMLYRDDRLNDRHDGPQMGLDGKWQANFYDPDGTRVELMEFQATSKPCCSQFTAESPND